MAVQVLAEALNAGQLGAGRGNPAEEVHGHSLLEVETLHRNGRRTCRPAGSHSESRNESRIANLGRRLVEAYCRTRPRHVLPLRHNGHLGGSRIVG